MALHDVAAKAPVRLHGEFEIDPRVHVNSGKRSTRPGFGRKVGAKRARLDVESSEADSADGDAVADAEFFRRLFCGNRDAAVFALLLDACDVSDFLDDAGKHDDLREKET